MEATTRALSRYRVSLVLGYLLFAVLRVYLATLPPAETTDVLRNLGYGRAFWRFGLSVYDRTPSELDACREAAPPPCGDGNAPGGEAAVDATGNVGTDGNAGTEGAVAREARAVSGGAAGLRCWSVIWPDHTFDYPIAALLFYAALAGISTSLVVARVVLGGLELVNALLVARLTRSRVLGLAYFASPLSLWWVSREGQFEPVVVLFMLLAIQALRARAEPLAYAWLALAIQTKLFPVLLLPYFLARARHRSRALVLFGVAFLPSAVALAQSRYIGRMFQKGYWAHGFNPFAWATWRPEPFVWMPRPLVLAEGAVATFLVCWAVFVVARALARGTPARALQALPVLVFVVVVRSLSWGQFWYLLLVPAFALCLEEREDYVPLLLASFLEPRAVSALFVGPIGLPQWFPVEQYLHGGA